MMPKLMANIFFSTKYNPLLYQRHENPSHSF